MTVTRIIDEKPCQSYTQDWIDDNQDYEINGELVSNWTLAPEYIGYFLIPKWNGREYYEAATPEEILADKQRQAIEIDLDYTERIAKLKFKHNDNAIKAFLKKENYNYPQEMLDKEVILKAECNAKIEALGITDYTYRQSVPELMKTYKN